MHTKETIALDKKISSMNPKQMKKRWSELFNRGYGQWEKKITFWEDMEFTIIDNILFPN